MQTGLAGTTPYWGLTDRILLPLEITFTYHRVGLNTLNNLVANMKSWGKANAITCASFCAKMRKTDEDFTKCNAFVLDTSWCWLGYADESLLYNISVSEVHDVFIGLDFHQIY